MSEERAVCRGCGKTLDGKPYFQGGFAYDPDTKKQAKKCYYGGWVCSRRCDEKACLKLEQSMPGHGLGQTTLGTYSARSLQKWDE
jgi:hypothetical protein